MSDARRTSRSTRSKRGGGPDLSRLDRFAGISRGETPRPPDTDPASADGQPAVPGTPGPIRAPRRPVARPVTGTAPGQPAGAAPGPSEGARGVSAPAASPRLSTPEPPVAPPPVAPPRVSAPEPRTAAPPVLGRGGRRPSGPAQPEGPTAARLPEAGAVSATPPEVYRSGAHQAGPATGRGAAVGAAAGFTGLPGGAAIAVLMLFGAVGLTVDLLTGTGLRAYFAVFFVAGCVLAGVGVRRRDLGSVLVAPPFAYVVLAGIAGIVQGSAGTSATRSAVFGAATTLVLNAPVLLIAEGALVLLAVVRWRWARHRAQLAGPVKT